MPKRATKGLLYRTDSVVWRKNGRVGLRQFQVEGEGFELVSLVARARNGALSYEGWGMVFIGFVSTLFAFGATTTTMPLLYGEVIDQFGWSRTDATLIYTFKNIASAVVALFLVGPVFNRIGLRRAMIAAFLVTGLAMIAFLWISSLVTYCLVGAVLGVGVTTVFIGANVLVSRWFIRNQGLAVAVTLAGGSAAGLVFPGLAEILINWAGWRAAFALLSVGIWAVALPLFILMAKDGPTEDQIRPEIPAKPEIKAMPKVEVAMGTPVKFGEVLRSAGFWLAGGCIFLTALVESGVSQHTVLYLEREAGIGSAAAVASYSLTLGLSVAAKVGAGKLFDLYSLKAISAWYLVLALSIAAVFPVQGLLTLAVFTGLRAFAHGGLMSECAVIAKHCYGPNLLNVTVPIFVGVWTVGAAFGPTSLSMIYDRLGSYDIGLWLFVAMSLIGALLLLRVRPTYRDGFLTVESPQVRPE